jgi:arylsulfatase A-like enzyme/tetratricopeptide (TPR) repeat protein
LRKRKRAALFVGAGVMAVVIVSAFLFRGAQASRWPERLTSGSARGFNVLLITLDTTRADHLGCYGHDEAQTTVLDALAEGGIRFVDAVTPVPTTLPSHATILTGLDPPNHGVRNNGEFKLADEHQTLAEILRGRNYRTAAFVSAFVLDERFGLGQGFEHYDDQVDLAQALAPGSHIAERSADITTRAALQWLANRDAVNPFFMWVHYFDPHRPWNPPADLARQFADQPYDGEIAHMDRQIGVLLDAVNAAGLTRNTLTVVVADHGEGLGEHNEPTHANLIYDSTMRVPMILSCPSLIDAAHEADGGVVSIADLLPTVLDLLGIDDDTERDGRSLVGGAMDPDRALYIETLAPYLDHGWSPLYGLRRHRDKYIMAPRPEYYDLAADPDELENLHHVVSPSGLRARDQLLSELKARLAAWPSPAGVAAQAQPLDPSSVRKLQSLGYLGTVTQPAAGGALPDPKDMMPIMHAVAQAESLMERGQLDQALIEIKRAADVYSGDPRVTLTMGAIHVRRGDLVEALRAFRQCVASTANPRFPLVAAETLLESDRPDLALEFLEPLWRAHPQNADALLRLAIAYQQLDRLSEALDALVAAERIDQTRVEIYTNLATCLRRMGRSNEAVSHAQRAAAMAPDLAQAHHTLGLVLIELGREDEAYTALATAHRIDSGNAKLTQDLAALCISLERWPDAVTYFQLLADLVPTRWQPRLALAQLKLQMGLLTEARAELNNGLQLSPQEPSLQAFAHKLAKAEEAASTGGG